MFSCEICSHVEYRGTVHSPVSEKHDWKSVSVFCPSACLLLHCPKTIMILVKYPNLILTVHLKAVCFGKGRRIFLKFLECFLHRCYIHDDFWQAVRYNKASALSFVIVYLSKLYICSLFQLQSNLPGDYLKEHNKVCWITPALKAVACLGVWHRGWLDASNSSCKAFQTALSSKFTLLF